MTLFGSLAWTGIGHGTDTAVLAGLAGMEPATADPDAVHALPARIRDQAAIDIPGIGPIAFDAARDIVFDRTTRPAFHPNTLSFRLRDAAGATLLAETWFSVGGGFILREGDAPETGDATRPLPYPFRRAAEMLALCATHGLSIPELQFANETALRPAADIRAHIAAVAATMEDCIDRGLRGEGELPGGLRVRRRAAGLAARIEERHRRNTGAHNEPMDRASVWAIAVNEENAAGGRVVTAPTNGAAGIIPAVLRYWRRYTPEADAAGTEAFLLTAAAVGALLKTNASISGAEMGCQGEVGSRLRHGRRRPRRRPWRHAGTGGECRRNRPGTPSWHDLRPNRRPGANTLHRTQRHGRHQGDQRRLARPLGGRDTPRQPR